MRKYEQFILVRINGVKLTTSHENYAKTLTESTFNFSISSEEIRGGQANALFGKYFHDSNLAITLTDVNCIA